MALVFHHVIDQAFVVTGTVLVPQVMYDGASAGDARDAPTQQCEPHGGDEEGSFRGLHHAWFGIETPDPCCCFVGIRIGPTDGATEGHFDWTIIDAFQILTVTRPDEKCRI